MQKGTTKVKFDMAENIEADWYKCCECCAGYILEHFDYCPSCGRKIDWESYGENNG